MGVSISASDEELRWFLQVSNLFGHMAARGWSRFPFVQVGLVFAAVGISCPAHLPAPANQR